MDRFKNIYRILTPILIVVCCVLIWWCWFYKTTPTSVFLVRHADRLETDGLNTAGFVRADELARVLDEADVDAIYSSNFNRTQQTVAPLATALGISTTIYDHNDLPGLADLIRNNHKGQTVVIVGHSNTVGPTIGALGITNAPGDLPHDEFDHLYLVTLSRHAFPKLTKMEYGADTP
jgi:2,3-bisphosphoglycerate-dependent phosphoglycerate mutase